MSIGFRKNALNKLSSPERLDKALSITKPFYWIAVAGALILAAVFIAWSCLYVAEINVDCRGAYIPRGDVHKYSSDISGIVSGVNCSQDDIVQVGQTLFTFDNGADVYKSPVSGKISMLCVSAGQQIKAGDNLVYIRTSSISDGNSSTLTQYDDNAENYYIAYVPYKQLSYVTQGATVQIQPDITLYEDSGHMSGVVTKIGNNVLDKDELMSQLGNDYGAEVIASMGTVIPVEITIDKDSSSQNGFKWTKEQGSKEVLHEGVFADISINAGQIRPIDIFIPSSSTSTYN